MLFSTCRNLLLALCCSTVFMSYSQNNDIGNWLIYVGNKELNKKVNLHHEVQYRNYNAIGNLEQLLLRTGIGVNLTENNNNLLLGYGYITSENYIGDSDDKITVHEHRIYQQFITKQSFGRVNLQQRWIEDNLRLRFRYFLAASVPLSHQKMIDNTFYLSVYNEIFINTESTVFDRNRLYGGLGYKVNDGLRFEAGYMNQFLNGFGRDQINLIAFLSF
jgi:hypothetical protein